MGNNNDRSENKRQDIPLFELGKKGRIQLSIYKMTTGFIAIDQDTEASHSLTSTSDIKSMLGLTADSLIDTVISSLNDKKEKEFTDITIIVETKQETYEPPTFDYSQPPELGFDQIAELVEEIIRMKSTGGMPFNLPSSPYGRTMGVTADMVQRAMLKSGTIKVKTRYEDGSKGASQTDNTQGKKFFDSKKQNQPQDQNRQKNPNDKSEPHKLE